MLAQQLPHCRQVVGGHLDGPVMDADAPGQPVGDAPATDVRCGEDELGGAERG